MKHLKRLITGIGFLIIMFMLIGLPILGIAHLADNYGENCAIGTVLVLVTLAAAYSIGYDQLNYKQQKPKKKVKNAKSKST